MESAISLAALSLGLLPLSGAAAPSLLAARADVSVTIPSGDTIIGSAADGVESFKGIPYADPPTGDLRLRPPQKLSTPLGTFNATGQAKLCPQGPIISFPTQQSPPEAAVVKETLARSLPLPTAEDNQSEDCLTITITRPEGTQPGDALPVLFYIFGGGFLIGGTSAALNDPLQLVQTGVAFGKPFIFAAVNYRVGGWGFMPGEEILNEGSANAGLLDQRMGLEWVADNIEAFGGNSSEVTIWGQSAGSISVWDQLVLYDGDATYNDKPLFRAAIMNSGSVTPVDPVDSEKGKAVYQHVVEKAGCDGSDDTLGCLRNLTNDDFAAAANSVPGLISYESLALSYLPRPDGKVLTASPHVLAREGKFHAVPMIFGSQEDEGTIFSWAQVFTQSMGSTDNITDYLSSLYFHNAERSLVKEFVETYSELVEDGSPYRRGEYVPWIAYPGKKRLASILGDIVFTLVRRLTLENVVANRPDLPVWSSLASYNWPYGIFGTQHGSDTAVFFGRNNTYFPTLSGRTYYINFVHDLDPNVGLLVGYQWPKWTENNELLWYNEIVNWHLKDDFRSESYDFIKEHIDSLTF
ncbi:putative extracellular lipase [Trichoderma reesei RUT C-30]|jgi:carboxylesterase type B|uniref:Carboxylic ester hydrolase n=1 Tax=Hypocrea jecorina (strain ATCC 56765 / BCRC 32924 / NRRL 11460 / Rut C-30) TaxID=1344414 RepID=A0A024SMJ4_HYPJR|nr:putative extracellular lipase [Trichoderma reesei RUT C-30]